jgi:nitroreductase
MTRATANNEIVAKAIRLACRAPSLHNSQPWRWIVGEGVVDLFVDHERILRSTDRSGREALISCGAALGHFRIAMAAAGWKANVDTFPSPAERDHLASLDFSPAEYVTAVMRDRAEAMLKRRTDRLPFYPPSHWKVIEPALRNAVDHVTVSLDVLPDDARPALAVAAGLTESVRRCDEYYHDEMRWWTESFRSYQGVPPTALVSDGERERVGFNRTFPATQYGDRRPDIRTDEAKVLVLSTPDCTRADALNCGEALSGVLIECTMAGLATCTLSHITELPKSRAVIQELIDNRAVPQLLVRVGNAPVAEDIPAPTPRLPLSEVMQMKVHESRSARCPQP